MTMRMIVLTAAALSLAACGSEPRPTENVAEEEVEAAAEVAPLPTGTWEVSKVDNYPPQSVYEQTISSDGETLSFTSQCVRQDWAMVREGGGVSFQRQPTASCDRALTDGERDVINAIDAGQSMIALSSSNQLILAGADGQITGTPR